MARSMHEIYEASAGAGKTHRVIQKVLSLLHDGIKLEEILVVTFTEKAAGELVDRLRQEIIELQQQPKSLFLGNDQDDYENAQVFTIHAFCLGILRQFPYIHGAGGNARLVSDREVLRLCLRDIERRRWPEDYRSVLSALLAVSGFGAGWEKRVLDLASAYRPACRHQLLPGDVVQIHELEAMAEEFNEARAEIAKHIGPLASTVMKHPLYELYGRCGDEGRRDEYLAPVLLWACDAHSAVSPIASFIMLSRRFEEVDSRFSILTYGMKAKIGRAPGDERGELTDAMKHFEGLARTLTGLRERLPDVTHALAVATVRALQQRAQEYKAARGLQSFEDFLTRVADALDENNPHAAGLIASLRKRYKAAIVDEFQDTDVLQWRIFRRIFMDDAPAHRLIVVGDPKQAIYAFRNADLETYIEARDTIAALNKPHSLHECYRATAELLKGLNAVFDTQGFFGNSGHIQYRKVQEPDNGENPALTADQSRRKAITAVRIPAEQTGGKARPLMASFIAGEIERLINRGAPLLEWRHRGEHKLGYRDIAVLFFFRSEAEALETEFRRRNIPYSFYKKMGIWQSDEAIQLHYVLSALAHGGDRGGFHAMLLTRCFGLTAGEAARLEQAAAADTDNIFRLFTRWRELSLRRRWGELFRSILADTHTLHEELREFDGARRVANFNFIANELSRAAYQNGFGLHDIVSHMQQLRLTSRLDEANLQPAESDQPAVKLTTIHTAKGLEFPVVFLAGGFTYGPRDSFSKYHDDARRVVLNMDGESEPGKSRAKLEAQDEKRRLLYVAMTRAMLKLYVPYIPRDGDAGWLRDLLTPALEEASSAYGEETALTLPAAQRAASAPPKPAVPPAAAAKMKLIAPLLPRTQEIAALAARRLEIQSFTRLLHMSGLVSHTAEPPRPPHEDDDEPRQYLEDDLPPGPSAGEALHNILEEIDFGAVKNARGSNELFQPGSVTGELIERSIRRNMALPAEGGDAGVVKYARRAAQIVWNTLHTKIPALGDALCTLDATHRLHELEFHMHVKDGQLSIEELKAECGFVTGWMDLVFRHAGKYYLLDWKSNALPAYAREDLEFDMKARRYDLQYRIYLDALRRWFARTHRNFDETKDLGGVFYIYMRGMDPGNPSSGIFFESKTK